jgi:hypothetical protein
MAVNLHPQLQWLCTCIPNCCVVQLQLFQHMCRFQHVAQSSGSFTA